MSRQFRFASKKISRLPEEHSRILQVLDTGSNRFETVVCSHLDGINSWLVPGNVYTSEICSFFYWIMWLRSNAVNEFFIRCLFTRWKFTSFGFKEESMIDSSKYEFDKFFINCRPMYIFVNRVRNCENILRMLKIKFKDK